MINKKKISMHHRSCIDIISAKIGNLLPLPTLTKKGFTLAEVLITLSIIGIIAMLTVPSIMKNYRYKTYSASLKKVYSQLTDAVQAIMNDEMTTEFHKTTAGVKSSDTAGEEKGAYYFLHNYFKVAASCDNSLNTQCLGASYKSFSGADAGPVFGESCIRTTNGATICMTLNPDNGITSVFIDVNGPSDPNITGLDAFVANISGVDGSVTDWSTDETKCNVGGAGNNHIADYALKINFNN